jgi:hypothetical protein
MDASRVVLQRRLAELEAQMPQLMRDHPDRGELMSAFAGIADDILDAAGIDDDEWAFGEIERILDAFGLADRDR